LCRGAPGGSDAQGSIDHGRGRTGRHLPRCAARSRRDNRSTGYDGRKRNAVLRSSRCIAAGYEKFSGGARPTAVTRPINDVGRWPRSQKRARSCLSDDVDLPQPLRGFCAGVDFGEGQVIVARGCQLACVMGTTMFGDTPCDGDPAGPVQEAVWHKRLHSRDRSTFANSKSGAGCEGIASERMSRRSLDCLVGDVAAKEGFFLLISDACVSHDIAPFVDGCLQSLAQ